MLQSRILVTISLLILTQNVKGAEESSGDQDHGSVGSGNEQIVLATNLINDCDTYPIFSYCTLDRRLDDLTSNGLINITADVMLLSIVSLVALENVSIIGHDNPTVNCDNAGGIYFDNCHNCTIIGITWEKCGNKTDKKPAIELYNSADIIIQNCSFQHSVTQAIALSEVTENVSISSCKFVFNSHFEGNGAAIHYLSKIKHHFKFQFVISGCNFTKNGASIENSIVYIGPSGSKSVEQIYFTNNVFLNNRGMSIYISNQNIIVTGFLMFKGNKVSSGGGMSITNRSNIVFQKSEIQFISNIAIDYDGALHIQNSNMVFNTTTITFIGNEARLGGALDISYYSDVTFEGKSTVMISNTKADLNIGLYLWQNSSVRFKGNSTVIINNNQARALCIHQNSYVTFEGNSTVTISSNQVNYHGAFSIYYNSNVTFKENSAVTINKNHFAIGALDIRQKSNAIFEGNCKVKISNNQADLMGGAFYVVNNSSVTFEGNSTVIISNNQARFQGGALYILEFSDATFKGNSTVTISNNQAGYIGGAFYMFHSIVTFEGTSAVTISNSQSNYSCGALSIVFYSTVTFEGNSSVTISNNQADHFGGAFCIYQKSNVTFEGNSTITINNNRADSYGGAFYITDTSNVTFEGNCAVTINNNQIDNEGGVFYVWEKCDVVFQGKSIVTISNNHGRALYIFENSDVIFKGNSTVTISNNEAHHGGALYIVGNCDVTFKGNCTVYFNNNVAKLSGGALYLVRSSLVLFEEDSCVVFHSNIAGIEGGAFSIIDNCKVTFKDNSKTTFNNNKAIGDGGALYAISDCVVLFQARSTVQFNDNKALGDGGALYSGNDYNIMFENNCTIIFDRNEASLGGAIFTPSNIMFIENSSVHFHNNKATLGGALHVSSITFKENTVVIFTNNEAITNGGAIYSDNSEISVKQNSVIIFISNSAENGGAVYASASTLLVSEYSNVTFDENIARQNGGAIYFNNQINANFNNSSVVTLASNTANNHGGAIYSKITQNTTYFNISEINDSVYRNNTAGVAGNLLYIDVPKSCNNSCLTDRIVGVGNQILYQGTLAKNIATSPKILQLCNATKCVGNKSADYISNIMLGQEIIIYPCLLDHYNKPAEVTQFRVIGENNQNYFLRGSEYISISCDHAIKGISIVGSKVIAALPLNYSMYFTSYTTVREVIATNLTVKLSSCYLGFQYQSKSQRCECYNNSRIVSCSGSSSTIARGYWFGHVTKIPTVTICPINYCNFTCCRTTNGYYQLSPERVNQCKSYRSGIACGSCEEGYSLSYGSAECISTNKCNTRLTTLVVTLTILYWLVVVVAAFIIMYYQVGIGYFYVLTYYYSIVDIILSQHTDLSDGLYISITIMSSIAKISPQFLGHLCLFKNMSGIDQQFLHYIHPLAVSVILIIISWLARHSKKLSMFISRGIIHAICFLLLLSYTSVATTSLLLMRSLTFAGVDSVYTFLSPDIQYFHGHHLVYGITAIILTLLIVIGLPLLLLTEPFLNRKISYFRIKPLLDQFQGCYKDKYRWFAGYYMICRLIIIIIIIANFSDVFISQYLSLTASTIIALVHEIIRPYGDKILNVFDGTVLQLLVLVTALPLFETFDSSLVIGLSFILVILPLIQFTMMKIHTNKQTLVKATKNAIKYFQDEDVPDNNIANDSAKNDIDLVIDDGMRKNATIATICEM